MGIPFHIPLLILYSLYAHCSMCTHCHCSFDEQFHCNISLSRTFFPIQITSIESDFVYYSTSPFALLSLCPLLDASSCCDDAGCSMLNHICIHPGQGELRLTASTI